MRIAKIKIVRHPERPGTAANQVARGLGYGDLAAFVGVQIDVGGVAINCQGDELFQRHGAVAPPGRQRILFNPNHGRIRAGGNGRAVADGLVVLAVNPIL